MAAKERDRPSSPTGGRVSAGSEAALEPELERRIHILEHGEEQPTALAVRDWGLIAVLTLVIPAILLVIAWNL